MTTAAKNVQASKKKPAPAAAAPIVQNPDSPNLFISWSGDRSKLAASAFKDWIRMVAPSIRPWFSPDIDSGAIWRAKLADAFETCNYALLFVTKANSSEPWINYEAGAIASKLGSDARIMILLLDNERLRDPLGSFQSTKVVKGDVLKLVLDMNRLIGDAQWTDTIRIAFEQKWPELETALKAAEPEAPVAAVPPKTGTELALEALVEKVSSMERLLVEDVTRAGAKRWQPSARMLLKPRELYVVEPLASPSEANTADEATGGPDSPGLRVHKCDGPDANFTNCGIKTSDVTLRSMFGERLRQEPTLLSLCGKCFRRSVDW